MKPVTSNLAKRWGLPRPIMKSHAAAEASDFKFGMQLGFAKGHHKITPRGKVGMALG